MWKKYHFIVQKNFPKAFPFEYSVVASHVFQCEKCLKSTLSSGKELVEEFFLSMIKPWWHTIDKALMVSPSFGRKGLSQSRLAKRIYSRFTRLISIDALRQKQALARDSNTWITGCHWGQQLSNADVLDLLHEGLQRFTIDVDGATAEYGFCSKSVGRSIPSKLTKYSPSLQICIFHILFDLGVRV